MLGSRPPIAKQELPQTSSRPSCRHSAGLMVMGIHHRKGPKDDTVADVRKTAKDWKLKFPIAIDNNWSTVHKYWTAKNRSMTSASFLIDKNGKFAWIHAGGILRQDAADAKNLETAIRKQLGVDLP